ncbi:MAG: hydrogenase maturation protease [Gaiellaceae bacterium]
MTTCVVGVGNAFRGDDAVGLEVVRRLEGVHVVECEGEPVSLIDAWHGFDRVVLVDAMQSGAPPGTVRRIAVDEEPLPPELSRPSTHLLGVADAVELARVLGRLPGEVVVYAIEGDRFDAGGDLTPVVAAAAELVAAQIQAEVVA